MANDVIIKIGTKVKYRGCFGSGSPEIVEVRNIERGESIYSKYGKPVGSVPFSCRERCVFDLSNGHWCYGDQIDSIVH